MKRYLSGSDWARWDLHIHSPYSILNNGYGEVEEDETWDKYIYELITRAKENDIVAVGITDYFIIDGYIKVKEILNDKSRLNSIYDSYNISCLSKEEFINYAETILILPNIELRLNTFVEKNSVNYHVIFSEKLEANYIKENFLHMLTTSLDKSSLSGTSKKSLTESNIKGIGRKLKEEHNFKGSDFEVGLKHITVDFEEVLNVIENDEKFVSKNMIVVPSDEDLSDISWDGRDHGTRKMILKSADAFFTSNQNSVKWALGKFEDDFDKYIKEFGKARPCIHGSDAHRLEDLFRCDKNRYCWIKAKPTFEGLLQILSEPESRVKISDVRPNSKNAFQVIDYIEIKNDKVQDEKIYFNENLTSIIGGRSTGKSILLNNLANNIDSEQRLDKIKEIHKEDNLFTLENMTVHWKDGTTNSNKNTKKITYIPQSYLNRLVEEKEKDTEIDKIIKKIIFQNEDIKDKNIEREKQNEDINILTNRLILELLNANNNVGDYTLELKENGHIDDIENELTAIEEEIKKLSIEDIDIEKKVKELKEEMEKLQKKEKMSAKLLEDIKSIKENMNLELSLSNIDLLNNEKYKENILLKIEEWKSKIHSEWIDYKKDILEKYENENKSLTIEINDIKHRIGNLEEIININDEIAKHTKNIRVLKEKLEKSKELEKNIINKNNKIEEIINQLSEIPSMYENIAEEYKTYIDERLEKDKELKFYIDISAKESLFAEQIKSIFDNRNFRSCKIEEIEDEKFTYGNEFLKKLLNTIIKEDKLKLKGAVSKDDALRILLKNYYNINYLVEMEGDNITSMSPGKKSLVLLRLLIDLSKSKWPILLDQPEDDLDNRSIYKDLVGYIKEKKEDRQIIVVTHNANIVIGSDSEQIIIANQNGDDTPNHTKQFEYRAGAIENNEIDKSKKGVLYNDGIKNQICRVLEGGERAFELRSQKYFMK